MDPTEIETGCVDAVSAARMAATLDWAAAPSAGDPLPALWHWMLLAPIARASELGADGHPALAEVLPEIRVPMRMWAGSRLRFLAPVRIGDVVERRSRIHRVERKQGRSGTLGFVTFRHEYRVGGQLAIEDDQDLVYRERPRSAAPPAAAAPATGAAQFSRTIEPQTTLLFRYSALTFNAHRIHYDRDYATREEGYPGLLVQGPLTATLLAGLFEREFPAERIAQLSFRAERALYDTAPFSIHGRRDGARAELWAQGPDAAVAMRMEIVTGGPDA